MNNQKIIWELRVQQANTERRRSQIRHYMTGHDFYLDDIDYWSQVKTLAKEYIQDQDEDLPSR